MTGYPNSAASGIRVSRTPWFAVTVRGLRQHYANSVLASVSLCGRQIDAVSSDQIRTPLWTCRGCARIQRGAT